MMPCADTATEGNFEYRTAGSAGKEGLTATDPLNDAARQELQWHKSVVVSRLARSEEEIVSDDQHTTGQGDI